MEGKVSYVYYSKLTQEEKDYVDNVERQGMMNKRKAFIKDERYKDLDPEDIWYLRLDYIKNWKHSDSYLFTKCECGSLDFDCLSDIQSGMSRRCLMKCCKCGKTHMEFN